MRFSARRFLLPVLPRFHRFSTGLNSLCALLTGLALATTFTGGPLRAQAPDRVTTAIDPAHVQVLKGHRPAWALAASDAGALSADLPLEHMSLVLARSPEQEAAFEQLLKDQQNPASPEYHHWLTPVEVGQRFGLSDNDIAAVSGWLTSQGLHVNWVSPSRIRIGFGGTASSVDHAFQTELHNYKVNGELLMAPVSDPVIPQAIASAVKAIQGIYTINNRPLSYARTMSTEAPEMTLGTSHFITPGDFAVLYDLPSAWNGAGKTIGIVGESRTDMADFANFRTLTGSTFANPTEIVPTAFGGVDPGPAYTTQQPSTVDTSAQAEATLDVTRAGSVAPGANMLLVVASAASGGIGDGLSYLVETTPVPAQIIDVSWGLCESDAGSAAVQSTNTFFQQAAAEGISVFVSSGDAGASGCDAHGGAPPTSPLPNSPNYLCSSSYVTCVGGTEFADTSNPSQYWSSTNGTGYTSALSYIPEGAWNEPSYTTTNGTAYEVAASGGGVSAFIPTPAWQTGTGVPAARAGRYTPDISFSASGHDGYLVCLIADGGDCTSYISVFGGTSAAAPDMAGIAAVLDQKQGSALGNLNPAIYSLAATAPSAFHDVTVASSGVGTCALGTPSMCNNSIAGPTSLTGGQAGYMVGTGYDEVTGLGSLDVTNFLNDYSAAANAITPTVTVTTQATSFTTAQTVPVTITVSGGTGNPVPTGTYALTATGTTAQSGSLTNGTATYTYPAGFFQPGTYTFTATYTPDSNSSSAYKSASGTSSNVTVNPGPAVSLAIVPSFSPASIGQPDLMTVTAYDAYGNVATAATDTIHLTSTDTTATLPANFNLSSGVAAQAVQFGQTGTFTITASDTTNTGIAAVTTPGILVGDNIWVVNADGTVSALNQSGAVIIADAGISGTTSTLGGTAFDSQGNVWSVVSGSNTLSFVTAAGTGATSYSGGGLSAPVGIAVDGAGSVWVVNSTGNSVSQFLNNGTAHSGSSGYGAAALSGPTSISIDNTGGLWIPNLSTNSVTHIIGVAAPVVTPQSKAVTNVTVGVEP